SPRPASAKRLPFPPARPVAAKNGAPWRRPAFLAQGIGSSQDTHRGHGMMNRIVGLALVVVPMHGTAAPLTWELGPDTELAPKLNLSMDRAWFSGEPRLHDGH